jgi:hypothetical protein
LQHGLQQGAAAAGLTAGERADNLIEKAHDLILRWTMGWSS